MDRGGDEVAKPFKRSMTKVQSIPGLIIAVSGARHFFQLPLGHHAAFTVISNLLAQPALMLKQFIK
jgi:hypothetical protein